MCLNSRRFKLPFSVLKRNITIPVNMLSVIEPYEISVSCGKCVECRIQYSNDWSFRCNLEAKKYKENCFITLTYNEENKPSDGVQVRDVQLFMKRLRKAIYPAKVRYYAVGEYGERYGRPHYHIILFGYDFSDKYIFKRTKKGEIIDRSPFLESLWTKGFSSVGHRFYEDTSKYLCKYMTDVRKDVYALRGLNRPFSVMSRKPGIALDVIPKSVIETGYYYYNGFRKRAPLSFRRVVERDYSTVDLATGEVYKPDWTTAFWTRYTVRCLLNSVEFSFDDIHQRYKDLEDLERRRAKWKRKFPYNLDNQFCVVPNRQKEILRC